MSSIPKGRRASGVRERVSQRHASQDARCVPFGKVRVDQSHSPFEASISSIGSSLFIIIAGNLLSCIPRLSHAITYPLGATECPGRVSQRHRDYSPFAASISSIGSSLFIIIAGNRLSWFCSPSQAIASAITQSSCCPPGAL